MFILCTEKEAGKKRLEKCHKILISSHLEDVKETKHVSHLTQLTPSVSLFKAYMNGDINKKKYVKKYISTIVEDDELHASLIMLILAHEQVIKKDKNGVVALVVSSDEMNFHYMQALAQLIYEMYGVPVTTYSIWRDNDFKSTKTKLSEEFHKSVKRYKHLLFGDYNEYDKVKKSLKSNGKEKDKKKSNKKDKKKSDKKKKSKKNVDKRTDIAEFIKDARKESDFEFAKAICKTHVLKIRRKKKW